METIRHRDLRNDSSKVLARVAAGESFAVTNHGDIAAVLLPPGLSELDRLTAAGKVREPRKRGVRFTQLPRTAGHTTQEILDDIRGRW
ncbi:type II toxin-antitoxin system Phd/YefM family antitoxin [Sediminivirga luteola]|uniref:type II toxin-antitoxin system Phd/YefM family antitoxin n=1 Tax=Sediminivirga luteola TaxID=1774748 RepID=UPI001F593F15|nr:type II toxin-antitoxin system prevent-host-death family antitoxin [Sediminivirga luteola]MCI2265042.1 type II toxin-antitoxin system prevent-host-death family antitoxin [Sediminivirga luteola]